MVRTLEVRLLLFLILMSFFSLEVYSNEKDSIENPILNSSNIHFNKASQFSLNGVKDSAFVHIAMAIEQGVEAGKILTDSDFIKLYNDSRWNDVKSAIGDRYLKAKPSITKKKLAKELFLMFFEDQRFRTLSKNYKLEDDPWKQKMYKFQSFKDREVRMFQILDRYGWPLISEVGFEAAETAYLVCLHSNIPLLKKGYDMTFEIYNKKPLEINKFYYTRIIDRFRTSRCKRQIYGTQLQQSLKMRDGKLVPKGELKFMPIKKAKHVNMRRKDMGLIPIEEYAKKQGVEYKHRRQFLFIIF